MSTTGALWRNEATVDAGTVTTGSLVLLVGGQSSPYTFTALSAGNLTPGQAVRAPLTVGNGGSTDMTYGLTSVTATAVTPADQKLAAALLLTVTMDEVCGQAPSQGVVLLDRVPVNPSATFAGSPLAPSSSETLCIEVALNANAPITAAAGTTSVTFTFRGDQES
ncbi:hypothetical protein [Arthrobacter pascens]|uniref:hypothetical protein n=1 Tax=Arthrobacter pascens TaxID=1677 RepID=UPI0027D8F330|nr:hypothetical protein [Arthrobacter pascens]